MQLECQRCLGRDEYHSPTCIVRTVLFQWDNPKLPVVSKQAALDAAVLAVQDFNNRVKQLTMSGIVIPFEKSSRVSSSTNSVPVPASENRPLERLKLPFREDELEYRLAQCGENNGVVWGKCLTYITSRAIMDRLDSVCGEANWRVSYEFIGPTGVICNLSIRINGEWITKQDGAEHTNIEAFKGGISSALKRAGSAWGMGRYLYTLEPTFIEVVNENTPGAQYGKTKSGKSFFWVPQRKSQPEPKPQVASEPKHSIQNPVSNPVPKRQVSENQLKRLYAIANSVGLNRQTTDALIKKNYHCLPGDLSYQDYRHVTDEFLPQKDGVNHARHN